jgi:hypothetical protein
MHTSCGVNVVVHLFSCVNMTLLTSITRSKLVHPLSTSCEPTSKRGQMHQSPFLKSQIVLVEQVVNVARALMDGVRRRKGLVVQELLVSNAAKQRTLARKK